MTRNTDNTAGVVVAGKPEAEKEPHRYRLIMAYSDTSRLKEIYAAQSPEERETFMQSVIGNTSFRVSLKHN